jgi:polyisoprenoid-binding protein YceI
MHEPIKFDQSSARCYVFTYKEGLLSGLGHDLRIAVTSFSVEVAGDAGSISARFDARSLRVDCAMREGGACDGVLTGKDKKEIDENILGKVLETGRYKDILLTSSSVTKKDSSYAIKAALTLHGKTKEISFSVTREGDYHVADFLLHLPDFNIKPFTALFGMIKIKPDILVRVMIPGTPGEKGLSLG